MVIVVIVVIVVIKFSVTLLNRGKSFDTKLVIVIYGFNMTTMFL